MTPTSTPCHTPIYREMVQCSNGRYVAVRILTHEDAAMLDEFVREFVQGLAETYHVAQPDRLTSCDQPQATYLAIANRGEHAYIVGAAWPAADEGPCGPITAVIANAWRHTDLRKALCRRVASGAHMVGAPPSHPSNPHTTSGLTADLPLQRAG